MPYIIKHITAFFDLSKEGMMILDHAAKLAQRFGAHLVGVFATISPDRNYHDGFARGSDAISNVAKCHLETLQTLREEAKGALDQLSIEYDIGVEFRAIDTSQSSEVLSLQTLYCDVVVAGVPQPPGLPPEKSLESLLLRTGAPALVIPKTWEKDTVATRVIIAWNASRVARRAISDAMPILATAQAVRVLIVDAEKYPHGEDPGADLAVYLTRHGVTVDVLKVASDGKAVADVLIEQARLFDADLMVIGAYSRSRLIESVLGGVTKSLVSEVPLPLFVAH